MLFDDLDPEKKEGDPIDKQSGCPQGKEPEESKASELKEVKPNPLDRLQALKDTFSRDDGLDENCPTCGDRPGGCPQCGFGRKR